MSVFTDETVWRYQTLGHQLGIRRAIMELGLIVSVAFSAFAFSDLLPPYGIKAIAVVLVVGSFVAIYRIERLPEIRTVTEATI